MLKYLSQEQKLMDSDVFVKQIFYQYHLWDFFIARKGKV